MALLNILEFPNELLIKKSKPVDDFSGRLHTLLDDMRETLIKSHGIGLAAPQVGVLYRVALVDTGDGIIELINPKILKEGKFKSGDEGCLSVPDFRCKVKRPHYLEIEAQDRNGKTFTRVFEGIEAVCAGHEIDHLDGKLIID